MQIVLTTLQSVVLGWLSEFFTGPKTPESTKSAYLMALTITLIGFISAVCRTWEMELALETGELHGFKLPSGVLLLHHT